MQHPSSLLSRRFGFLLLVTWLLAPALAGNLRGEERETIKMPGLTPVQCIALSPDNKYLAVVGKYYTLELWDLQEKKKVGTLTGDENVNSCVAFSPDGKTLAARNKEISVKLLDVPSLKVRATIGDRDFRNGALAYSPDGKLVATVGGEKDAKGWKGLTKAWDVETGNERAALRCEKPPTCLVFSDNQTLITGDQEGTAKIWDVKKGKETATLEVSKVPLLSLAVSNDGKTLAVGGDQQERVGGTITLFDMATKKQLYWLTNQEKASGPVTSLRFSPDGKYLVSSGRPELQIWEVSKDYKLAAMLSGHEFTISCVTFSRDGKTIVSHDGHTTKLWDMPAFKDD
jgi:WD40 repeat protein